MGDTGDDEFAAPAAEGISARTDKGSTCGGVWWTKRHVPAAWRAQKSGELRSALLIAICVAAALQAGNCFFSQRPDQATLLFVFSVATFFCTCIIRQLASRPRAIEHVLLLWYIAFLIVALMMVNTEEDQTAKHRMFIVSYMLGAIVPMSMCIGIRNHVAWLVLHLVAHYVFIWCNTYKTGGMESNDQSFMLHSFIALGISTTTIGVFSLFFHMVLLRSWFVSEQTSIVDRKACAALIAMFCDATCCLAEDGDTITSCDRRLDDIMGRSMTGERMFTCIAQSEEREQERSRLAKIFQSVPVSDEPVPVNVVHMTLEGARRVKVPVDLYIVGHNRGPPQSACFLIGVCCTVGASQQEAAHEGSPVALRAELTDLACGDSKDTWDENTFNTQNESSMPASSISGHVFNVREGGASQFVEMGSLGRREHWLINKSDIRLVPTLILGRGSFGMVVGGVFYGSLVAVKLPLDIADVKEQLPQLCNELRVLRHLRHPNLVHLHGAVLEPNSSLGLVLEFVSDGNLHSFIADQTRPAPPAQYQILIGTSCALWYLHSLKPVIVHGDLKSRNVLLVRTSRGIQPKLADFGLSRLLSKNTEALGGTIKWMAPEVLSSRRKRTKPKPSADVFSFGRLLFNVATLTSPLANVGLEQVEIDLRQDVVTPLDWKGESFLECQCRPIAELCLLPQSAFRPTMRDVHEDIALWSSPNEVKDSSDWAQVLLRLRKELAVEQAAHNQPAETSRRDSLELSGTQEATTSNEPTAIEPIPPEAEVAPIPEAVLEDQPIGQRCRATSGSAVAATPSKYLLVPRLKPTSAFARQESVRKILKLWNFEVPRGFCCSYHAGLHAMIQACTQEHRKPCQQGAACPGNMQCNKCGLLLQTEDCCICDERSSESDTEGSVSQSSRHFTVTVAV